jgi:hypothetical protein
MLLHYRLFVSAYAVATTNAAVKIYGSERPKGDYVTCEVPDVTDDEVSAALGMFYFPGEIVQDSTDLQFNETLVCGDFASIATEFACYDLGGESICVPTHPDQTETDAEEETTDKDSGKVSERSPVHLDKRAGGTCNEWTLECKNQHQSTTGWCASDYTAEYFEVKGHTTDVWCSKPCTEEEVKVCQDQKCPKGKDYCERFGYVSDCAKALTTCVGSPVKMPEKSCTTKYMSGFFESWCKNKEPACVAYENGSCQLNAKQYKAFEEYLSEALGGSWGV